MAGPREELNVVIDRGGDYGSSCGYCGAANQWFSHGMSVRTLTVYAYQDLIDQGWRRSGRYLYKPDLAQSCCKAYTIRLDVQQFNPDKGQRRLMRKWREYLAEPPGTGGTSVSTFGDDHEGEGPAPAPRQAPGAGQHAANTAPAPSGASAPPPQRAAGPTAAPHEPESEEDRTAQTLQHLLAAALASAVADGELPSADYAPPVVRRCSAKQQQSLPADGMRFTSPAAFAVAAAAARSRVASPTAGPRGATTPSAPASLLAGPASAGAGRAGAGDVNPSRGAGGNAGDDGSSTSNAVRQTREGAGGQPKQPDTKKQTGKQKKGAAGDPASGQLSAQDIAQVLARRFNQLACPAGADPRGAVSTGDSAAAAKGTGAGAACGTAMQSAASKSAGESAAATTEATAGGGAGVGTSAASPDAAAPSSQAPACGPEAHAANGHLNFRVPGPQGRDVRDGHAAGQEAGTGPEARVVEGRVDAASGPAPAHRQPKRREPEPDDPASSGGSRQGTSLGSASLPTSAPGAPAVAAAKSASGAVPAPAADHPHYHPADSLAVPGGRLEIRLVPSTFLEEEYELYTRYQVAQHGDDPAELSRVSYSRFLVDSPLRPVGRDHDPQAPQCGYGSFHQQYWLDGKLIAVGVVDVLPRCLSSVYLFWDPDHAALALGRFSALQEIQWVQQALPSCPALRYYYMGFYIHTCTKMRYKAEYRPSDLLCPVRKVWVRITPALLAALDRQPYLQLSCQPGATCQPNLAAPPGHPAARVAAAAAVAAATGPAERSLPPAPAPREGHRGQGSSAPAQGQQGPWAQTAPASRQQASGGGGGAGPELEVEEVDVGSTLVVLPSRSGSVGPLTWEIIVRLQVIPRAYFPPVEAALRAWRAVVDWAAPSLVYQLS